MDLCNSVNEWLEQDPAPDLKKIPGPLSRHIESCPACRNTVGFFRNLALDKNVPCFSTSETGEFMKQLQAKILSTSQERGSQTLPEAHILSWPTMRWACAGALIILLLVIGSVRFFKAPPSVKSEEVQSFAVLKGKATLVSPAGKEMSPALGSEQNITQETEIKFNSSPESVEVQYQNGGKVYLTGIGQMKIQKDTIDVENGKFNARFKNLAGILKVRVPCAVLAIRGTEIEFDIQPLRGEILLVEGAVDMTPDNPSQKPFKLRKGKKVLFANNTWSPPQSKLRPSSGNGQNGVSPRPVAPDSQNYPPSGSEEGETIEPITATDSVSATGSAVLGREGF